MCKGLFVMLSQVQIQKRVKIFSITDIFLKTNQGQKNQTNQGELGSCKKANAFFSVILLGIRFE